MEESKRLENHHCQNICCFILNMSYFIQVDPSFRWKGRDSLYFKVIFQYWSFLTLAILLWFQVLLHFSVTIATFYSSIGKCIFLCEIATYSKNSVNVRILLKILVAVWRFIKLFLYFTFCCKLFGTVFYVFYAPQHLLKLLRHHSSVKFISITFCYTIY